MCDWNPAGTPCLGVIAIRIAYAQLIGISVDTGACHIVATDAHPFTLTIMRGIRLQLPESEKQHYILASLNLTRYPIELRAFLKMYIELVIRTRIN
jgi:hypothetical protein